MKSYLEILYLKGGIIEKSEKKIFKLLEEKSGFHPEDELEVMRPEHFILPACILLGGLTAASITFLCEILYNKTFKGRNTTDIDGSLQNIEKKNHEDQQDVISLKLFSS